MCSFRLPFYMCLKRRATFERDDLAILFPRSVPGALGVPAVSLDVAGEFECHDAPFTRGKLAAEISDDQERY
jgi:hypothetical protein